MYYNEEGQKQRITKWYQNEKERAENSEIQQVKEYAKKFAINIEQCSSETIKIWIKNLKIIEKKIQKAPKNDIRRYLNARMMQNEKKLISMTLVINVSSKVKCMCAKWNVKNNVNTNEWKNNVKRMKQCI